MNVCVRAAPLVSVLIALTLVHCPSAVAADGIYEAVKEISRNAQGLQERGEWNNAKAQLAEAAEKCGVQPSGRACRLLVHYSQGFLAEQEARRTPQASTSLLAEAESQYLTVLAEAPQHAATLKNLALIYRETNRNGDAERLLQREPSPGRKGTIGTAMLLGQIYRDANKFDEALSSYEQAALDNPDDPSPPQAIVGLYAAAPVEKLAGLLPRLAEWTPAFPAVAEEGYRRILIRASATPDGEKALFPWVSLIAQQGWASPGSLAALPKGWAPLDEVVRFTSAPEQQPSSGSWWMQEPLRRSVFAQLALATGQAPEARADPARALRRYEVGLLVCPRFEEYQFRPELKAAWPTRMELTRATLSLLSRQPQLDPAGQRQQYLVGDLFGGKAGAYRTDDVVAMQRFHTTLGRWYAERGDWAGSGSTNARFQLENAIRAAEVRASRGEPYQPLQDEKGMLADGYLKLGELAKARTMFLRAAAAFLDTDQLKPANDAVASAKRIIAAPIPNEDVALANLIERIFKTREALGERAIADGFEGRAEQSWLLENSQTAFLRRQQFKALADLALQSETSAPGQLSARRASAAFSSALKTSSLVGTADLLRLEKIKTLVTIKADIADPRASLLSALPTIEPGAVGWALYVPSETASLYLKLGADVVLAGRVDAALQSSFDFADAPLRYQINAGMVKIQVPKEMASMPVEERLRQVPGVRSVVLMENL